MNQPINALFFRDFNNAHIPEIFEEIYLKKIYDPYTIGKTDLVVADIGANIGLTSFYFKDFAKHIYAIEPSKIHQETLKTMLEYNKIKNVTICPYAISNKVKKEKFYHVDNSTAFSLTGSNENQDFEEVDVITFDKFMEQYKLDHLDILKLDPEGEEGKIVTSDVFAKYAPKIDIVVGEWHSWSNMERPQFANVFRDLGYDFRWIAGTRASCYAAVRI